MICVTVYKNYITLLEAYIMQKKVSYLPSHHLKCTNAYIYISSTLKDERLIQSDKNKTNHSKNKQYL